MDSIFTMFLLFIAVLTALFTYMIIPYTPVVVLTIASAVALAVFLWWHWTQFSIEYRLSTWQEVLQNYSSYALLLLVILVSYGFYVFVWISNGGSVQAAYMSARNSLSNGLQRGLSSASRSLSSVSAGLVSEAPAVNRLRSRNSSIALE